MVHEKSNKGKVTIEIEGLEPVVIEMNNITYNIQNSLFCFYDHGDFAVKDMAPSGQTDLSISGFRPNAQKEFEKLQNKYPICEPVSNH